MKLTIYKDGKRIATIDAENTFNLEFHAEGMSINLDDPLRHRRMTPSGGGGCWSGSDYPEGGGGAGGPAARDLYQFHSSRSAGFAMPPEPEASVGYFDETGWHPFNQTKGD